jgi:hypothetical protein
MLVASFGIVNVFAVHDELFQLDGDTSGIRHTTPTAAQTKDWDDLFNADGSNNTSLVSPGAGTSKFTNADFVRDFGVKVSSTDTCSLTNVTSTTFCTADKTTFATGSKDTLDITGWQCNTDHNVNSKIDIMNAYAAAYTAANGDKIIYFGMDKNKNNGSNNVGFWFLQGNANCVSGGGSTDWSGQHTVGDVLVVSEFSNGGGVSTALAYKWVGGANPLVLFGSGGDCKIAPVGSDDAICATTNAFGTTPPSSLPWNQNVTTKWRTADATLGVGTTVVPPDFFEGGINLTKAFTSSGGTVPSCFNTFVGDTRSSTSLTSTLFDYARGVLGECFVDMTTTPSQTTRTLGSTAAITDTADVVGHSSSGGAAPTPTGSVSFFLCGPSTLTTLSGTTYVADPNGTCNQTDGTAVGSAVTVTQKTTGSPPAPVPGTATATSADAQSLISGLGKYCFRATFTAAATDNNYPGATALTSNPTNECFTVTASATTRTEQKWLPQDTAFISATGGATIAGTVDFVLYEGSATCTAGTGVTVVTGPGFDDRPVTFNTTTKVGTATTDNGSYYTTTKTISWQATFTSSNGVGSGTAGPCETSSIGTLDNDITTP